MRDDVGPYFQQQLQTFAGHPAVTEIRGCQLIGALELVPRAGKAALTPTSALGIKGSILVREEGVIVRGIRDLLAAAPPLTITREEIDLIFAAITRALDRLWD